MPVHASTQMGIAFPPRARSGPGIGGLERVILARELSPGPDQARSRKRTKIGLEVFVHGALCYCFSGQCLFSSMLGGRSGNRGLCAQPCRKEYELGDERGYMLSTADTFGVEAIPELMRIGVKSIKIEGRMRNPLVRLPRLQDLQVGHQEGPGGRPGAHHAAGTRTAGDGVQPRLLPRIPDGHERHAAGVRGFARSAVGKGGLGRHQAGAQDGQGPARGRHHHVPGRARSWAVSRSRSRAPPGTERSTCAPLQDGGGRVHGLQDQGPGVRLHAQDDRHHAVPRADRHETPGPAASGEAPAPAEAGGDVGIRLEPQGAGEGTAVL